MIKCYILTIFLLNISYTKEEFFLNKYEYGYELYKNPKGVSCQRCHGLYGKKRLILRYMSKNKEKKIFAPNIKKISFESFLKRLSSNTSRYRKKPTIMPKYYLSHDEILSIYNYLQTKE